MGLRLAFDKPVVIVKDDKTSYSFDTSSIEHLTYPRDLRFNQIVSFTEELTKKIEATHSACVDDPESTSFLKHFGQFQTIKIDTQEVSTDVALLDQMNEIRSELRSMRNSERRSLKTRPDRPNSKDAIPLISEHMKQAYKELGLRGKAQARANKIEGAVLDT